MPDKEPGAQPDLTPGTDLPPDTAPDTQLSLKHRQRPDLKALLSPQQIVAALKDHAMSPSRDLNEALLKEMLCGLLAASDTEDACEEVIAKLDAISPNLVADILIYHGARKLVKLELPREIPQPIIATTESLAAAVQKAVEMTLAKQAMDLEKKRANPRSPEDIAKAWLGEEAATEIIQIIKTSPNIRVEIIPTSSADHTPVKLIIETDHEIIILSRTKQRRARKNVRQSNPPIRFSDKEFSKESEIDTTDYNYALIQPGQGNRYPWAILLYEPLRVVPEGFRLIKTPNKKLNMTEHHECPNKRADKKPYKRQMYRDYPVISTGLEDLSGVELLETYVDLEAD